MFFIRFSKFSYYAASSRIILCFLVFLMLKMHLKIEKLKFWVDLGNFHRIHNNTSKFRYLFLYNSMETYIIVKIFEPFKIRYNLIYLDTKFDVFFYLDLIQFFIIKGDDIRFINNRHNSINIDTLFDVFWLYIDAFSMYFLDPTLSCQF